MEKRANSPSRAGQAQAAAVREPSSWEPAALARLLFDAAGVAIGVGYLKLAGDLGTGSMQEPSPGFFPMAAGILIVLCLAVDLIITGLNVRRRGLSLRGTGRMPLGAAAILASIAVYLLLVEILGHALTASLVSALLLATLGRRRWWKIVIISLACGFLTDVLFGLLGLRLPTGMLEFGWSAWT